jgi:hypothetical protein
VTTADPRVQRTFSPASVRSCISVSSLPSGADGLGQWLGGGRQGPGPAVLAGLG